MTKSDNRNEFFRSPKGAGVLVMAKSGRFLALLRSDDVDYPRCWGIAGGSVDIGEDKDLYSAALREFEEEAASRMDFDSIKIIDKIEIEPYKSKKHDFTFHNFLIIIENEFEPTLNYEGEQYKWVDLNDWPMPAHFGMEKIMHPSSLNIINDMRKKYVDLPMVDGKITHKKYPPLLYFLVRDGFKGEYLQNRSQNRNKTGRAITATTNPRETFQHAIPSLHLIDGREITATGDFMAIADSRFLKKDYEIKIYRFRGAGYTKLSDEWNYWHSNYGPHIEELELYKSFDNISELLKYGGLHLFSADDREEAIQCVASPIYPYNLNHMLSEGIIKYVNSDDACRIIKNIDTFKL